MRRFIFALAAVVLIAGLANAQDEKKAERVASPQDTLMVSVAPGAGANQFQLELTLVNAQPLAGMVVPLEVKAPGATLTYDSISYAGGRLEYFQLKSDHVPETNKSTLLLGLIADLSGSKPPLPVGRGTAATLYYTADKAVGTDKISVKSVRIPPANVLDYTTPQLQSVTPTFVVKTGKAAKKAAPAEAKEKGDASGGK